MSTPTPRVSIGLAVRNGERYLDEAIQSILAQTFTDLELIISDNASDDRTADICQHYAQQDARIRYSRNATNIGGANNENLTFRLARGEYFRWAAHDDVLAPTLIEKCVSVLDAQPDIVVCYSGIIAIDENGKQLRATRRNNAAAARPSERFAQIASSRDFCEETYGLMRAAVLGQTQLQKNYTASDRTLMAEISLYGRFCEIPEFLFYKRFHPANTYVDWRARMAWFDTDFQGSIVFPFWMQLLDYCATLRRVNLSKSEKLRCYLFMAWWLVLYGKNLTKDLLVAGYMLMHNRQWRREKHARLINWT